MGVAPFPVMDEADRPGSDGRTAGNVLLSECARFSFNETGLREVARIADWEILPAQRTRNRWGRSIQDIDKLGKKPPSAPRKYQQYRDLFPVCIAGRLWIVDRASSLLGQNHLEAIARE